MPEIRVLIVDDEPLIRRGLRDGLSRIEDVSVMGECGNGAEAVATILEQKPDLVLLDVQMPGCSGLEVVEQVGSERMPAVIFVTAYDRYASRFMQVLGRYDGRLLVADEAPERVEGEDDGRKLVVLAFADREAALAWANSPAYREIAEDRLAGADTIAVLARGF